MIPELLIVGGDTFSSREFRIASDTLEYDLNVSRSPYGAPFVYGTKQIRRASLGVSLTLKRLRSGLDTLDELRAALSEAEALRLYTPDVRGNSEYIGERSGVFTGAISSTPTDYGLDIGFNFLGKSDWDTKAALFGNTLAPEATGYALETPAGNQIDFIAAAPVLEQQYAYAPQRVGEADVLRGDKRFSATRLTVRARVGGRTAGEALAGSHHLVFNARRARRLIADTRSYDLLGLSKVTREFRGTSYQSVTLEFYAAAAQKIEVEREPEELTNNGEVLTNNGERLVN